jgi:HEAT repeat protein
MQLGNILDGRVSDLFGATTAYTTPQHPDEIRQAAVYLLAVLDHPMRDETLAQLAQSDSVAVQQAVQTVRGEAGVTDGDTVTEEVDGVSFTFSADLLSDLENLKDSNTQQRLTNIGVDAVPALMYAIADKQYAVYHYVLDILDAMTDDTLPQQMEQYVQMDELPYVQAAALHTLGSYPEHPGLLTYLRQALNDATHPQVHQTALEALAEVGSADDIDVIVPHLESTNGRTRTLAGLTLVDLGDMRGAPTVFMQAESEYPGVRLQAVERLPKIDTKEAREHLKRLTKDDDERVRQAAKQAL